MSDSLALALITMARCICTDHVTGLGMGPQFLASLHARPRLVIRPASALASVLSYAAAELELIFEYSASPHIFEGQNATEGWCFDVPIPV
jgi:hypothetical protein